MDGNTNFKKLYRLFIHGKLYLGNNNFDGSFDSLEVIAQAFVRIIALLKTQFWGKVSDKLARPPKLLREDQ